MVLPTHPASLTLPPPVSLCPPVFLAHYLFHLILIDSSDFVLLNLPPFSSTTRHDPQKANLVDVHPHLPPYLMPESRSCGGEPPHLYPPPTAEGLHLHLYIHDTYTHMQMLRPTYPRDRCTRTCTRKHPRAHAYDDTTNAAAVWSLNLKKKNRAEEDTRSVTKKVAGMRETPYVEKL